jgi:hypothetical protein
VPDPDPTVRRRRAARQIEEILETDAIITSEQLQRDEVAVAATLR